MNYYNEHDPMAAAWLRELIAAELIPAGEVDERDIQQVKPVDLAGFTQCHFFGGIGGWPWALQLAGWGADRPVWTGSLPCQPFSQAGQQKADADERHLWPVFYELVNKCRPSICFGEQVASPLGREWLAGVRADLEASGYRVGAANLCAAGAGAPHIRQRLYWVALARQQPARWRLQQPRESVRADAERSSDQSGGSSRVGGLGITDSTGSQPGRQASAPSRYGCTAESAGAWSNFDVIPCADRKTRRIERGTFPLVNGLPRGMVPSGDPSLSAVQATAEARAMRLKGYGNAIVPPLAAEFIAAFMDL